MRRDAPAPRTSASAETPTVQAKLRVGRADDPLEREADHVADQVMSALRGAAAFPTGGTRIVRRGADPAAAEVGFAGGEISPGLASQIERSSGGSPLQEDLRARMEGAFGADFGAVRIHRASALPQQISARAFTVGTRIHFAPGTYDPSSDRGRRLLAHELAHVTQQGGARALTDESALQQGAVDGEAGSVRRSAGLIQREIFGAKQGEAVKDQRGALYEVVGIERDEWGDALYCLRPDAGGAELRTYANNKQYSITARPGALTGDKLALLTTDVDDADLDEGSKLLKQLRLDRATAAPKGVNLGGVDKLSNCALTTLGGILGVTSTAAAVRMRAMLGVTQNTRVQSEKVWAISLMDAETLHGGNALTRTELDANEKAARGLDEFPAGRTYALGSAQYFVLLKMLLKTAEDSSTAEVEFSVRQHGIPGETMFPEATLLSAMAKYPNGTRFAVFVYSSDPTQHVRQHWLYAERIAGRTIFQDFQTNTGANTPADAYLEKFPFSPNKQKDAGKGFEQGTFVAIMPTFSSEPPAPVPDPIVDPAEVAREIDLAKTHIREYRAKQEAPLALPTTWGSLGGPRLDTIPAPSDIRAGYERLAAGLGVTLRPVDFTRKGFLTMYGNPRHRALPNGALIDIDELNRTTKVKSPGRAPRSDATALPVVDRPMGTSGEAEEDYYAAFSKSYNVAAATSYTEKQKTLGAHEPVPPEAVREPDGTLKRAGDSGQYIFLAEGGIRINADRSAFTDIVHESAHVHELAAFPDHIKEGLAEVLASMVCDEIVTTFNDNAYQYAYNPSYSQYVVTIQQLVDLVGLKPLARYYFESASADNLASVITAAVPAAAAQAAQIAGDLLDVGGYPAAFMRGIDALRSAGKGATPPSAGPWQQHYTNRTAAFGAALAEARARLGGEGKVAADATDLDVALKWNATDSNKVAEARLRILYAQADEAAGQAWTAVMMLVGQHEQAIAKATGETEEQVRARLKR
jgi:hypothetical protein